MTIFSFFYSWKAGTKLCCTPVPGRSTGWAHTCFLYWNFFSVLPWLATGLSAGSILGCTTAGKRSVNRSILSTKSFWIGSEIVPSLMLEWWAALLVQKYHCLFADDYLLLLLYWVGIFHAWYLYRPNFYNLESFSRNALLILGISCCGHCEVNTRPLLGDAELCSGLTPDELPEEGMDVLNSRTGRGSAALKMKAVFLACSHSV